MRSRYCYSLFLIFIALIISVFLNQDRIIRIGFNDSNKHAVPIASSRSYLGDEYHYYVEANDSLKLGLISKDKVYSTNNVLFGSLLTSGLINLISQRLISSSDIAVLVSLIVQTFLLVLATIYAIKRIAKYEGDMQYLWLGFWAFIGLILTDFFIFNSYEGAIYLNTHLSFYPNMLRVVNPQMGWAYALLYFAVLFAFSEKNTRYKFLFLIVMSLLFSFYSPSLCLTMLLALAIMIVLSFLKNKVIDYSYLVLWTLLLFSFLFNYLQLHDFQTSNKGLEIGTGVLKGIVFKPHYFVFLLLIFPIAYYYRGKSFLFITSVLISSIFIGSFCESIHLGERLWVRGAAIYVWIICIALVANFTKRLANGHLVPAVGMALLSLWTFFLLPHKFDSEYGYMNTDKWVLLDWINKNLPSDSIIMSEDLEFSFLLPIYTFSKPFVPLFSYSNLSAEETVKKYYYTLDKYNLKDKIIEKLKSFNTQMSAENLQIVLSGKKLDDNRFLFNAFFNYLIYYPFTKFSKTAFNSPSETQHFFATLENWKNHGYSGDTKVNYVISKHNQNYDLYTDKKLVFKTDKYQLFLISH